MPILAARRQYEGDVEVVEVVEVLRLYHVGDFDEESHLCSFL
jgi:hypothetical protein